MIRMVIIGYCNVTRFSILSSQWSLQKQKVIHVGAKGRARPARCCAQPTAVVWNYVPQRPSSAFRVEAMARSAPGPS
jgi:hypothetical protein